MIELSNNVKRFAMDEGECCWCGRWRKRTYDYAFPGWVHFRIYRPNKQFCNKECCISYHS